MYKEFFKKIKLGEKKMNNIICIDGVVGVGKSTLSEILSKELGIEMFEKPVLNNPLLDKFYHNKERYSFPLQVFFLNKRFEMLKEAEKKSSCVMDRSIYGDVIFAKMLMEEGNMTKEEYDIYEELLNNMLQHISAPKLMIYLKSSVDKAIEKIKKRGRDYEQIVERKYWEDLNRHYRDYFNNYNLSKVIVFNMDELDVVKNPKDKEFFINKVKEALNE